LKNEHKANTIVFTTANFGDLLSFFVIGFVSFVFVNYHSVSQTELIGVVMALLYITGPISVILDSIPQLTVANISVRRVNILLNEIPKENIVNKICPIKTWNSIQYKNIEYHYESNEEDKGFSIGPLDFEINKGEVTFIIGANGSGKSTLSKLITLHYLPDAGNICFGTTNVTAELIQSYRQEICAIYSDYYLFDRLLGKATIKDPAIAQKYLKDLQLSDKVKLIDGKFSTIALSDGQRKRLALLVAFLDDKSVYLFDEWAADQDPQFKEIFYSKILLDLKNNGKAVVVISHDDRYFDKADKLIYMEQGRITSLQSVVTKQSD
jgi:putative ATP-binding cassette transporter